MSSLDPNLDSDLELTPVVATSASLRPSAFPPGAFESLDALERYKTVARLGEGGMAEVFLAAREIAPFVHRPVVIKRLHAQFGDDAGLMQMFMDEARLVCQLRHENIVKTLEVGVIEGRCCIAMEYLEGQPLHRLVRRAYARGSLPLELAVRIAIAVLDALHYAHEARDAQGRPLGIVHRDVSPHNIFVCNDGSVKVLDFGIAKAATQEGRTATGIVKGKVGYIAPEQAAAEAVDRRADVWSVGVVLWEALTGARLFKAETDAATLNLTLKGEIPTAHKHRSDLPTALDVILVRALQRNLGMRYANAAVMRDHLQHWLDSQPILCDPRALGAKMRELFADEILEQRRVVSVLMARSDCTPPSSGAPSSGQPSSTSAIVISSSSPVSAAHLSSVSGRVDELTRRHRVVFRSLLGMLLLTLGAAGVLVYLGLWRWHLLEAHGAAGTLPPSATAAAPPAVHPLPDTLTADEPRGETGRAQALPHAAQPSRPRVAAPNARVTSVASASVEPSVHGEPPTHEAAPTAGFLTIDTTPWSIVSVGGKSLGQTPLVGVKLPAGAQTLSLRNPELGIETQYPVTIEPGKTLVRRVGLE